MNKIAFFLLVLLASFSSVNAQLKAKAVCPAFEVDILDGKVNGLKANELFSIIKEKFPCATSIDEEGTTAKCGAAIRFKDKDLVFFTDRDYVEIGEKFKGKLSIPLFGAERGSLFKILGNPKLKDADWDAFQTQYGLLVLYYNKASKVYLIRFSTRNLDTLTICE